MITKNLYEESTATIVAKVKRGFLKKKVVKFTFTQEGGATKVEAAEVATKGTEAALEITLPKVADGEDKYTLSCSVEADGQTYRHPIEYVVWPKSIELVCKDAEDKALAGATIDAQQKGGVIKGTCVSDGSGLVVYNCLHAGPTSFEGISPFQIDSWVKKDGRKREAKVGRKPYTVEILSPRFDEKDAKPTSIVPKEEQQPDQPLRQFVNMAAVSGQVRAGSLVTVRVAAKGDTEREESARVGKEGDEFNVKVTFTPDNTGRNKKLTDDKKWDDTNPQPGLLDDTGKVGKAESDGVTFKAKAKLGPGGAPAEIKVQLGIHGGDTCKIEVGVTDACDDATVTLQNWRKIYFQVTHAEGLEVPSLKNTETAFGLVFVEAEAFKTLKVPDKDSGGGDEGETKAPPKGSWVDASVFKAGANGRQLVIGYHNMDFFKGVFDKSRAPIGTHAVLMHQQYDAASSSGAAFKEPQSGVLVGDKKIKFPPDTGTMVRGVTVTSTASGRKVLPIALTDGSFAVKSCTWKSTKTPKKKGSIPLDSTHIAFGPGGDNRSIHIKLPAEAATLAEDGDDTIKVSLKYHYADGSYNGFAHGGQSFTRADRPDDADGGVKGVNGTIVHEIGHLITQAPRAGAVPLGLDMATHAKTYSRQGSHCANGSGEAFTGGAALDHHPTSAGCKCVMYGVGTDERNADVKFCALCAPFVKAEPILKFGS
ncbi:MAG: hypothetical protein KIT58_18310 [Planctomycetota bacterium]|nr:hypothetical protein [Planctomycetota bacterium]